VFDDFSLKGINGFLRQFLVLRVVKNTGKTVEIRRGNAVGTGLGVVEAVFES
jgi:hypothetical protein